MKRALIAGFALLLLTPLMLAGAVLAVAEQTDPAVAGTRSSADARALLADPAVTLSPQARGDLEAGVVDGRLVALLTWVSQRHTITISVFKTGHHKYVKGTDRVSNHHYGRAADIPVVDGVPVSTTSLPARHLVGEIAALSGPMRPDELGHPFGSIGFPGGFTDTDHARHIHIGYR